MTLYQIDNRQRHYIYTVYNFSIKLYIYALYTLYTLKARLLNDVIPNRQ